MGRAEKRAQERLNKKKEKFDRDFINNIAKAQANQKRLRQETINKIEDDLALTNVACIFNAFAYILRSEYNFNTQSLMDIMQKVDDLIGEIGNDEFPSIDEFLIKMALAHGIDIELTPEQSAEVERRYNEALKNGEVVDQ